MTYVRGIPTDWNHQRFIVHYTAEDLWDWQYESVLELSSDRVIDACVYRIDDRTYKMWYKDEAHDSHTWSAVSADLYHWTVCGENAYIFYFTHPFFRNGDRRKDGFVAGEQENRTCIQAARLKTDGGRLVCDRDEAFELILK